MSRLSDFDNYIENAMQSWHCPGVAVSIIREDDILHQRAYGLRDVKENSILTEDTRFAMASVTKSFTAMSVALLVDEGKLEWDKPVREYMPEFILNDPYATQHVTVRDMLSHRTGLPRHDLAAWRLELPLEDFIKRMRHFKFSASFREKFQYNNLMYYATAYLVEKVSGQAWENFVAERIFQPLEMTASNFTADPPQAGQHNAKGYRVDWDWEGNAKGLIETAFGKHTKLAPGAAGALFSTLEDLTTWLKVHVNEGRANDIELVSADNLKQMHLPQTIIPGGGISEALRGNTIFTYGMGWFIEPYRGVTLVHHGGNVEGHSLIVGFVPQEKVGVVVLTNIAQLPLRDVLLYESIDRALDFPEQDWNTKYHKIFDPIIIGQQKAKQTASEERLKDAPPTHALETYAGTFEADGYPDFDVQLNEGALQASLVGVFDTSELRHYHYNVFEWHWVDFDMWIKIRFLVNDNGEVASVAMPIESAVDDVVFSRKALELSDDVRAALVGQYEPPIEGLTFTVTERQGKLYLTQTGGIAQELEARTLTEGLVGFTSKEGRIDFVRVNDVVTTLILKTPFMTLEALRVAKDEVV